MRSTWFTPDVVRLLGPEHPLSRQLWRVAMAPGGSRHWDRDELSRLLLVLWREGADLGAVAKAAVTLGCEGAMMGLVIEWLKRPREVAG